jgi:hypothetical protein
MNKSRYLAAGVAVLAAGGIALGAGMWQGLPIVGSASYCDAIVGSGPTQGGITGQGGGNPAAGTATICAQTTPAGPPSLTGAELVPADTGGNTQPTTVLIPSGLLTTDAPTRNAIIGGDFAINPWQRGTTFTSLTPTTATMTADRWFAYSSGNTATISKQTGAADTIPSAGLLASMRVNRPSGTNTSAICVGQVLDAKASARFLGQSAILSFYGLAGAGYLATNDSVVVTIAYYTAADSATAGTNTATFALGTTAGYTAVTAASPFSSTPVIASGVATIPTTTTWTRYAVSGAIPNLNASGTQVTGLGISICTPVYPASTGVAGDWFEIAGVQLEANAPSITAPRGFEKRPAGMEETLAYYYSWGPGVEVNGAYYNVAGNCQVSGTLNLPFQTPIAMRTPPTSGGNNTLTAGGYSVKTAAATTAIGTIAVSTSTVNNVLMTSTAACTTTLPYTVIGTATTGTIVFSAEP